MVLLLLFIFFISMYIYVFNLFASSSALSHKEEVSQIPCMIMIIIPSSILPGVACIRSPTRMRSVHSILYADLIRKVSVYSEDKEREKERDRDRDRQRDRDRKRQRGLVSQLVF